MSRQFYIISILLYCSFFAFAGKPENHKRTFAQKDLFQTGYFLKNVPGLITDYNGQPIRYFADHDRVCVFLTDAGPVYKLVKIDEAAAKKIYEERERKKNLEIENDGARENVEDENPRIPTFASFTTVHWIGANPHPLIEAVDKNTGTYNYIAGTSSANKADLHSIVTEGYKKIVYHDMYPGIDVEYTFPDKGGIEYDLIVHSGADASLIKMEYGGAARSIETGPDGSMTIHTETGDILEHAPVSHTADGRPVASAFDVHGTQVSFSLPRGYDHSSTLTIDPWVNVLTQLTVRNLGCDVDYDVPGNLYIYGAGGANVVDINAADYEKVAKFNAAGTFLWVFNGSVPSVGWNTLGGTSYDYLSNMKVDRINETVYVGVGWDYPAGEQVIRLDNNGVYNNFISQQNTNFTEVWSFVQNCATGDIIPMGGGITGNLNMAVITPSTGTVAINNFTGIPYTSTGGGFFSSTVTTGYGQDVVSGAEDSLENLFVVMASLSGAPSINNTMYQVNSTYNGNIWGPVATGFTAFTEAENMPLFDNTNGSSSNNFNALAVNMSYLYYYDGQNLAAYSKTNGARVGTATTVTGANMLYQGGIAVDRCNNVYVGQVGQILTYTFNGSTFTQDAPISLGAGFTGAAVMDVRYNYLNNLLYVTGNGFAGTYLAVPSRTCIVGIPYTDTVKTIALVSDPCSYPEAVITVTPNISNPQITYVWQDSLGNMLQQHGPGTALTDTFVPTHTGLYTIQVALNANCGLGSTLTTFYINSRDSLMPSPPDTTVCPNQPVTLTAIPCAAGGAYLWSPGGATTQSITVTPAGSTNYIVKYTPLSGQGSPISDTIPVTVVNSVTVIVNSDTVCNGQPATLTAAASISGGTYSWSPGGATTQSITVFPISSTTYTVVYAFGNCGTGTDTGRVTVSPAPTVSVANDTACLGNTATLTATPSIAGGTYSWSPGGAVTQSITVSLTSMATYSVTYTPPGCNPTSGSGTVIINDPPSLSVNDTITCQGNATRLKATPTVPGGTYSWSPGGAVTQAITVTPPSTTTYTVTYIIPGCAAAVDSGTVNVTILPVVTINNDSTCLGQGATLTATPTITGGRFFWFPGGEVTQSITVNPPSTTNYTVTYVIPGSVCGPVTAVDTVTILPPPTLSVNNKLVCLGDAATLTVTPSETGGTYNWSPGGNSTQSITVSPSSTTTYRVAYAFYNCPVVEDSGTVTIVPLPTVAISIVNAICTNANGEAIAQAGSGTSPYSYLWSNPLSTTTNNLTGLLGNSSYTITATDLHHCTVSASALIGDSITPIPISDSLLQITCHGLQDGYISVASPGCNNCSYRWSDGSNTTSLSNLAANTYSLLVKDQNGCTSTASYTINDPPQPSLTILPYDTTVIEDSFVRFTPLFGPYSIWSINSYSWTPAVGLSCTDCAQPVFDSVSGDYTYSLVITYNNTCQDSTTLTVIVVSQHFIYVPNAFTPNGNGVDDEFFVFPRGGINFLDLKIFDRWGEKVFETHDPNLGWDGRFKGQLESPGIFVYLLNVTFDDNKSITKQGSISLIR